jgi:hypothetical protein
MNKYMLSFLIITITPAAELLAGAGSAGVSESYHRATIEELTGLPMHMVPKQQVFTGHSGSENKIIDVYMPSSNKKTFGCDFLCCKKSSAQPEYIIYSAPSNGAVYAFHFPISSVYIKDESATEGQIKLTYVTPENPSYFAPTTANPSDRHIGVYRKDTKYTLDEETIEPREPVDVPVTVNGAKKYLRLTQGNAIRFQLTTKEFGVPLVPDRTVFLSSTNGRAITINGPWGMNVSGIEGLVPVDLNITKARPSECESACHECLESPGCKCAKCTIGCATCAFAIAMTAAIIAGG